MTTFKEVSRQQYQEWRNHPVTLAFRKYLVDYRAVLKEEAWGRLQGGALDPVDQGEIKGRANTLEEVSDIPFDAIVRFYQTDEEADAAKTDQD